MIITGEIQSIGELLIENRTTGSQGQHMLLGWRLESICNYGSCLHGEGGDGDANWIQGHIQLASEVGMRRRYVHNCCRAIKEALDAIRWK